MADEAIKPVLSAEEWAAIGEEPWGRGPYQVGYELSPGEVTLDGCWGRHELAARVLHEQLFGFTWAMVDAIREAAQAVHDDHRLYKEGREDERARMDLARLAADRIESLLPPRSV